MANVNIKTLDPAIFLNSVGIGTVSPSTRLHLALSDTQTSITSQLGDGIIVENIDTTNNNFTSIQFKGGDSVMAQVGAQFVDHSTNAGDLFFTTRNSSGSRTEKMRILNDGKVGIGTASPDHFLEIDGGSGTDLLHLNSTAPILKVTATNNASGLRINAVGLTSGHLFRVQKDGTTKFEIDYNGNLILQNSSGTELLFNGSSNNANITSEGDLYLLAKTGKKLYLGSNNADGQIVLSDGQTYFYGQLNIPGGSGSTTNRLNFNYNSSNGVAEIAPDSSGGNTELKFSTCIAGTKSERMRIDDAGRIKIASLPTSDPGVAGVLYRDGSDVKISI